MPKGTIKKVIADKGFGFTEGDHVPRPMTVEDTLLIRCKRRCCLCYFWNGDLSKKMGQIAHIDHDRKNGAIDNLAFLCFDHHNEYDARQLQGKNITQVELKHARDNLYSVLKVTSEARHAAVTIKIETDFDKFGEQQRAKLLALISETLGQDDVSIVTIRRGSILVTLRVPRTDADRLVEIIASGTLKDQGITNAVLEPTTEHESIAGTGGYINLGSSGGERSQRRGSSNAPASSADSDQSRREKPDRRIDKSIKKTRSPNDGQRD